MKKAITILILMLVCSIVANVLLWNRANKDDGIFRREVKIDTIPYRMPVPVDSLVVRYVTDTLPIAPITPIRSDTALLAVSESVSKTDIPDSTTVVIPITQKVYEDSLYRAYVSGYRPCLDSIFIYKRTETVYIRSPTKTKRWSLGLQVGAGFTPRGPEPYIGIGVSYNLISF